MAIYHLHVTIISRSAGRSAVAAAAYRHGERLTDTRLMKTFDYRPRAHSVAYSDIMAPAGSPEWVTQREVLWNRVEDAEKRKDSQLSREIEVAIPRELELPEQVALIRQFVREHFVSKGMIADIAIHHGLAGDGKDAPHAHIMLTMRKVENWDFGKKRREWNAEFAVGKQVKKNNLDGLREAWAGMANLALEKAGCRQRIDHRSYAARGLDRTVQPKLGAAKRMEDRVPAAADRVREWERAKHQQSMEKVLEQRARHGSSSKEKMARLAGQARKAALRAKETVQEVAKRVTHYHGKLIPEGPEIDR